MVAVVGCFVVVVVVVVGAGVVVVVVVAGVVVVVGGGGVFVDGDVWVDVENLRSPLQFKVRRALELSTIRTIHFNSLSRMKKLMHQLLLE